MVEPLILLDEIGISLLGFPKFSSFFNPVTLRTTFMLGVGTFVMRFEVWYVTNCLLRGYNRKFCVFLDLYIINNKMVIFMNKNYVKA